MPCRFRWVSLQLDYICTLRSSADVRKRLGRLPKSLNHIYSEVFNQNFADYEPEDRKRLDIALSLLLLPVRPEIPHEFVNLVLSEEVTESDSDSITDESGDDLDDSEETSDNDASDFSKKSEEEMVQSHESDGSHQLGKNDSGNEGNDHGQSSGDVSSLDPLETRDNTDRESDDSLHSNVAIDDESDENDLYTRGNPLFDEITRLCFNLVVYDSTLEVFRFAHTSVQDYLRKHNERYQDLSECYARLAERCLSLLHSAMRRDTRHFPKFPSGHEKLGPGDENCTRSQTRATAAAAKHYDKRHRHFFYEGTRRLH